ncbi:MAG: transcription antitermination factor NusB [Sedimenticola sp.]|uniref:Transcription antitermination protein NusB n=1 Tax=Sedimenticola thiotaurini TaxID=1543721 RepID=A0A558CV37_9GAMM|nr:transcription antitermination factor NusB [Sedimenticola sp.]TVT52634.1 MAG: transcription antitermination factor NusB [Sedimenticola thiotaurini]MCW8921317.1 transcription antitermination factor NusB [Sedimenticola sp.]MCW8950385.1 transcription antitermination factor NusB [Sedimenticola sp.]MCW8974578.1 transcription antitermination factor NusB [Sedimenticola sp.]
MSNKRSQSRHLAVQAIYQWQVAGQDIKDIRNQFVADQKANSFELAYFEALLHGVPAHLSQLDELLGPFLDRSIESVDPVERAILRLGAFELQYQLEVPYKVIINESIELSKVFGAEQGHKYVNGVLDKLAHKLRKSEIK